MAASCVQGAPPPPPTDLLRRCDMRAHDGAQNQQPKAHLAKIKRGPKQKKQTKTRGGFFLWWPPPPILFSTSAFFSFFFILFLLSASLWHEAVRCPFNPHSGREQTLGVHAKDRGTPEDHKAAASGAAEEAATAPADRAKTIGDHSCHADAQRKGDDKKGKNKKIWLKKRNTTILMSSFILVSTL